MISQISHSLSPFIAKSFFFPHRAFNYNRSLHLAACPCPHKHIILFATLFFYCSCNVNTPTCQTLIRNLPCGVKCEIEQMQESLFIISDFFLCSYLLLCNVGDKFVLAHVFAHLEVTHCRLPSPACTYIQKLFCKMGK